MAAFPREELFHEPGPQDTLDYLWGRLQDRDLLPDEALALLGAVHHQLSRSRADPKVYFAYCRFMESLNRDMPVVHDYVVARWIESRHRVRREAKARRKEARPDTTAEDGQDGSAPESAAESPRPEMTVIQGGSGEEPERPGRLAEEMQGEGGKPSPMD